MNTIYVVEHEDIIGEKKSIRLAFDSYEKVTEYINEIEEFADKILYRSKSLSGDDIVLHMIYNGIPSTTRIHKTILR